MPLPIFYELGLRTPFSGSIPPLSINIAFNQNEWFFQEDRLCIDVMPGFDTLNDEQQKQVMFRAFDQMDSDIQQNRSLHNSGTTAITCICYSKKVNGKTIVHLITTNLANSGAYYVVKDKTSDVKCCKRLNSQLHKVTDPDEKIRIEAIGGTINDVINSVHIHGEGDKRVFARGFGDKNICKDNNCCISHTPDFSHQTVVLEDGETLLLMVATDGLAPLADAISGITEDGEDTKKIAKCCNLNMNEDVANYLASYERTSDNFMMVTHEITTANAEIPETVPVLIGVFDGHIGPQVSNYVANNMPNKIFSEVLAASHENQHPQLNATRTNIMDEVEKTFEPKKNSNYLQNSNEFYEVNSLLNGIRDTIFFKDKTDRFNQIKTSIKQNYFFNPTLPPNIQKVKFKQLIHHIQYIIDFKEDIDNHHNEKLDKYVFFIDKSDSYRVLLKELRDHAYDYLVKMADSISTNLGYEEGTKCLRQYRDNPVFSLHRSNHWFQKIGRTDTIIAIDQLIAQRSNYKLFPMF